MDLGTYTKKRHMFRSDWSMYLRFVNHSRLGNQHDGGGSTWLFYEYNNLILENHSNKSGDLEEEKNNRLVLKSRITHSQNQDIFQL